MTQEEALEVLAIAFKTALTLVIVPLFFWWAIGVLVEKDATAWEYVILVVIYPLLIGGVIHFVVETVITVFWLLKGFPRG